MRGMDESGRWGALRMEWGAGSAWRGGGEGGDGDGQCVDDWRAMMDGVLWLE